MDKQDELAAALRKAGQESSGYCPASQIDWDAIAAAVRSFMGSPEAVNRAELAAASVAGVDVGSLDVPVVQMTRAALSAAIGEDIGGGRG